MPSRKRERKKRKNNKAKKSLRGFRKVLLFFALLVLFIILLWVFVMPTKWDKQARLALAVSNNSEQGPISILIFDPIGQSITTISIPPNTEVSASHNLGSWPLGSIPALAKNEKLEGSLLPKTITKTLKFPVEHWADNDANGFSSGGVRALKAGLFPYKTSLTLKDKINLAFFALKSQTREDIDLAKTSALSKVELVGGGSGYKVRDNARSLSIAKLFSVSKISQDPPKIKILSANKGSNIENISQTIEVLGAKTYSLDSLVSEVSQTDCIIRADKETITSKLISNIYGCEFKETKLVNFDIEISFGDKFFARF